MKAASQTGGWIAAKQAKQQGEEAFKIGVPWSGNPHPADREDRFEWFAGWAEASKAKKGR